VLLAYNVGVGAIGHRIRAHVGTDRETPAWLRLAWRGLWWQRRSFRATEPNGKQTFWGRGAPVGREEVLSFSGHWGRSWRRVLSGGTGGRS
jgi:hypothetical protein